MCRTHTYITEELKDLYNEVYRKSKIIVKTLNEIEAYLEKAVNENGR